MSNSDSTKWTGSITGGLPERSTLVVMFKRPRPGQGKQRLAPTLGTEQTYRMAEALLNCVLEDASIWPGKVVFSPSDPADAQWAFRLIARKVTIVPQVCGNLGERLNAVDQELRDLGHRKLIFIGADAPLLDTRYYADAIYGLSQSDVVLGPAEDGGVTLMGSSVAWPRLASLDWSTGALGFQLTRLCTQHGLSVRSLPGRYDIDRFNDIRRLYPDLRRDTRPARRMLSDLLERLVENSRSVEC